MGDLVPFSGDWHDVVAAQLAELNTKVPATLERGTPAPDGLPPAGSWIRALCVDDDAAGTPVEPWHYVAGWDRNIGCLSTRCRRRSSTPRAYGLRRYLGEPPRYDVWRGLNRYTLEVSSKRPRSRVCRTCVIGLERDAAAIVAAERAAELARLVELLPAVRTLAGDQAIDDAERGRCLRELWPA